MKGSIDSSVKLAEAKSKKKKRFFYTETVQEFLNRGGKIKKLPGFLAADYFGNPAFLEKKWLTISETRLG